MMVYRNFFTNDRIGFICLLNKLKMPTCLAHSSSLIGIHCWNLSIFEKMIFPLPKKVMAIFFFFIPHFHFLYRFLVDVPSHLYKKIHVNFNNITIMKRKKESWINHTSFYTKFGCLNPTLVTKIISWVDEPFLSFQCHFVSLDEKCLIMITPTHSIEFVTNNFVMEPSFVDSILKLLCIDSKLKCLGSTLIDFGLESSLKYSIPKLFLVDSNSKFVCKPKSPTTSLENYCLVEFVLFG